MTARTGKIAQLPKTIRVELNQRLEDGQQSPDLLRWLNGLAKTKKLLAKKFDKQPITKSNLSDWRHGGFQDWRADQAREARIQRISESGASLQQAETGDLFENFARIAFAELMADLDSLKKLRDEKRSQYLHNLVRDLARLQSSYNRSRWAELAWTKYNDSNSGTGLSPVRSELEFATPCPPTSVVPDGGQSCGGDPHDSRDKTPHDPFARIYHTRCECGEPCPKCHAPDSEYPLDEVLRDKQFYRENGAREPYDRHGNPKHLMNLDCDCFCDRCAEKAAANAAREAAKLAAPPVVQAFQPAGSGDFPVPSPGKTATIDSNPQPASPAVPSDSSEQLADFSRRMALLNTASHRARAPQGSPPRLFPL